MTEINRFQLRRAQPTPQGAVRVDRGTRFGNPFRDDETTERYRDWLINSDRLIELQIGKRLRRFDPVWVRQNAPALLAGKHLCCWCSALPGGSPFHLEDGVDCHSKHLWRLANALQTEIPFLPFEP